MKLPVQLRRVWIVVGLALLVIPAARAATPWLRLRSAHFELVTDAGERYARGLLLHLEELRRLFITRASLPEDASGPAVRIIAFRSASEYAAYRLKENSDAYFFGTAGRDYIAMTLTGPADFRTAAHEYAHLMAHHRGLRLPAWLSEGLAEVYSTARFHSGQATLGEPDPSRMRELSRASWLPLNEVVTSESGQFPTRERTSMFYAESWSLTHMLMFSPAYSKRFDALLTQSAAGFSNSSALAAVYGSTMMSLESDLHTWISGRTIPSAVTLAGVTPVLTAAPETMSASDAGLALADLQFATGRREEARASYLRLEAELPSNPEIQAALGRIALWQGRRGEARQRFQRAIAGGIRDARLCYDYAVLAQDFGVPDAEVVAALERALVLDPDFDDARFSLTVAHMNASRYAAALQQFQAFRHVPERYAFAYYKGLAYTQVELGMREDALRSAAEASKRARTPEEKAEADKQAWMAKSEIVVQMSPDGSGHLRRIPSDSGGREPGWNPFIGPGDRIERLEGALRNIDCSAKEIQLTVIAGTRQLLLSLPDPSRVQVRKAGAGALDLTCGEQGDARVLVEYAVLPNSAAGGLLRGIRFLP